MTTEKHILYSGIVGEELRSMIHDYQIDPYLALGNNNDIYDWAVLSFHHALQAQECEECEGQGFIDRFQDDPLSATGCQCCEGEGWLERA